MLSVFKYPVWREKVAKAGHDLLRLGLVYGAGFRPGVPMQAGESWSFLERLPHRPKETVMLVHGWGADKENWLWAGRFLPRGWRLVLPDLPGFGATLPVPSQETTPENHSAHLLRLMETLELAQVHLVGIDMGAWACAALAQAHGKHVRSLSLFFPPGPFYPFHECRQAVLERLPPVPGLFREHILSEYTEREARLKGHFDHWRNNAQPWGEVAESVRHLEIGKVFCGNHVDSALHITNPWLVAKEIAAVVNGSARKEAP